MGFFSLVHWYCLGSFSSKAVSKSMTMCSICIFFSSLEVCSRLEISGQGSDSLSAEHPEPARCLKVWPLICRSTPNEYLGRK